MLADISCIAPPTINWRHPIEMILVCTKIKDTQNRYTKPIVIYTNYFRVLSSFLFEINTFIIGHPNMKNCAYKFTSDAYFFLFIMSDN